MKLTLEQAIEKAKEFVTKIPGEQTEALGAVIYLIDIICEQQEHINGMQAEIKKSQEIIKNQTATISAAFKKYPDLNKTFRQRIILPDGAA